DSAHCTKFTRNIAHTVQTPPYTQRALYRLHQTTARTVQTPPDTQCTLYRLHQKYSPYCTKSTRITVRTVQTSPE
ncbi:predicted protein, partial [Nematostella vectensis]